MGDKGALDARSLVAAEGGEWHGLLFDNPVVRLPAAVTDTAGLVEAPDARGIAFRFEAAG